MSKPIYKVLNDAARIVGVECNLNENSTFDEVSQMFEKIYKKADVDLKRKIRLDYKLYAVEAQSKKSSDKIIKLSSADLAGIINDFDKKELKRDAYQEETDEVLKFFDNKSVKRESTKTGYKLQNDREIKVTRNLNKSIGDKTKMKVAVVALGILCTVAVFSGVQVHNDNVKANEPISVVDVQSDIGEYELIEYEIQPGDYNKDLIAKRLGTKPDQIAIVGELSKQAGDIAMIKVYDRLVADDYNYSHKPVVPVEYDYHIGSGTNSLVNVAAEMMAEYPLLESYYWGYDHPANKLAVDLASQSQNKAVITDTSTFTTGDISIKLKITRQMADAYGITNNNIKN